MGEICALPLKLLLPLPPRTHYEMLQVSLPLPQGTLALHEGLFSFIGEGYVETKLGLLGVLIAIRCARCFQGVVVSDLCQ